MAVPASDKTRSHSHKLIWIAIALLLVGALAVWLLVKSFAQVATTRLPAFVTPIPPAPEIRDLAGEIGLLYTLDRESPHVCSWSDDGRSLITTGKDYSLQLWDLETGSLTHKSPALPSKSGALCSPDGRWAAFQVVSDTIAIADITSGEVITRLGAVLPPNSTTSAGQQLKNDSEVTYPVAWSSDSRDLFTITQAIETAYNAPVFFVQRWDIRGGIKSSYLVNIGRMTFQSKHVAISPNANVVAVAYHFSGQNSAFTELEIWDLLTGKIRGTLQIPGSPSGLQWSANGDILAIMQERQIRLVNPVTIKIAVSLPNESPPTYTPIPYLNPKPVGTQPGTLAPRPQRTDIPVAPYPVSTMRPTDYVPTVIPATLSPAADVNEYQSIALVVWSPDGKSIATYDADHIRFWDVASGPLKAIARHPKKACYAGDMASWSRDGRLFATLDCEGENRVLRLWDGKTAAPLRSLATEVHSFQWSPSETKLFVVRGPDLVPEIWGAE
jgi:WD40 repeat protein